MTPRSDAKRKRIDTPTTFMHQFPVTSLYFISLLLTNEMNACQP